VVEATSALGNRPVRGTALLTLKLAVAVGMIYLSARGIELSTIQAALARLPLSVFLFALSLQCATLAVSALRWHLCLVFSGLRIGVSSSVRIFFVSTFLGTALPAGIGQDVIRIYGAAKSGLDMKQLTRSTASVMLDRALGLLAFGLFAVPALVFAQRHPGAPTDGCGPLFGDHTLSEHKLLLLTSFAILILGVAALLSRTSYLKKTLPRLRGLDGRHVRLLMAVAMLSLLIVALVVVVVAVLGSVMTPAAPLREYILYVPLIALMAQLPISILGLGVREAGFTLLFACDSATRAETMALSIAYFAVGLLANMLGALAYLAPAGGGKPCRVGGGARAVDNGDSTGTCY
jgi:glycosyltransferase 2 family protein